MLNDLSIGSVVQREQIQTSPVEDVRQWRRPYALTALAPVRPDAVAALRDELSAIGQQVEDVPTFPLTTLSTTHFFRLLVTDAYKEPRPELGPHLLLATVFDGSLEHHLADLAARLNPALTRFFASCVDFIPGEDVRDYIQRHIVRHELLHIGAVRASLQDVRAEAKLEDALQGFVDGQMRAGAWNDSTLAMIQQDCLRFVAAHPELPQGRRAARPLRSQLAQIGDLLGKALLLVAVFAAAAWAIPWARQSLMHWGAVALLLGLAVYAAGLLVIRALELAEPDDVPRAEPDTEAVEALEDFQVQNQFTMLTPVRDSWARRFAFRVMLWSGNLLSEHLWNKGKLVGVGTIHFARIFALFNGRYMLFLSDYDGSWRRYLGDFLTVGAFAVVPIWAHLKGCPKTRFLYWTTPGFEPRFLKFTRTYQVPSQLWYSAYKNLTMTDILRAARIREGLFSARTDREIQQWLKEL